MTGHSSGPGQEPPCDPVVRRPAGQYVALLAALAAQHRHLAGVVVGELQGDRLGTAKPPAAVKSNESMAASLAPTGESSPARNSAVISPMKGYVFEPQADSFRRFGQGAYPSSGGGAVVF